VSSHVNLPTSPSPAYDVFKFIASIFTKPDESRVTTVDGTFDSLAW